MCSMAHAVPFGRLQQRSRRVRFQSIRSRECACASDLNAMMQMGSAQQQEIDSVSFQEDTDTPDEMEALRALEAAVPDDRYQIPESDTSSHFQHERWPSSADLASQPASHLPSSPLAHLGSSPYDLYPLNVRLHMFAPSSVCSSLFGVIHLVRTSSSPWRKCRFKVFSTTFLPAATLQATSRSLITRWAISASYLPRFVTFCLLYTPGLDGSLENAIYLLD